MRAILRKKGKAVGCQPHILGLIYLYSPFWSFALPLTSATLVLTSSFRSQTDGGVSHLIYISTIWRNYLFHLTYILYHIFNNFANYYWLWFLICTKRLKFARNGWTIYYLRLLRSLNKYKAIFHVFYALYPLSYSRETSGRQDSNLQHRSYQDNNIYRKDLRKSP